MRRKLPTSHARAYWAALTACLLGTLLMQPTGASAESETTTTTTTTAASPERRTLREGVHVDPELEALTQDLGPTLGERWGGAWVNADGTITVALTDDNPAPSPITAHPKVRVVTVRHSTSRLKAALESGVVPKLNALLAPGVEPGSRADWPYQAGISSKANVVDVTVDASHEGKRPLIEAALAEELAAGTVAITYGTVPLAVEECGTRESCAAPLRGGIQNTGATGNCTLGFVFRDHLGRRYQSTAQHCGYSQKYHAGRFIGATAFYSSTTGNIDFQSITQVNQAEPAPTNWVYRNANNASAVTSKITDPGSSLHGNPLCTEGYRTNGTACGALDQWNATFKGRCCFGKTAYNTCKGDSGAPVVNSSTNRAYGIHTGSGYLPGLEGQDCGTTGAYFSWVPYIEGASGLAVLLTPTTQTLAAGQQMPCGYALVSPDGRYNLQMQCSDGNLVIYGPSGAVWGSDTYYNPGAWLVMQTDGNMVIRRSGGTPFWNRPWGGWVGGSYLELQNDSNLVIYGPSRTVSWHRMCNCTRIL